MTTDQRDGLFYLLLASAGFAFMPTLVKTVYANSTFEPIDVSIWRFLFAVPLIWFLIAVRRKTQPVKNEGKMPIRGALLLGFIFSGASLTAFFGLERMPASTFIVLFYTYPAMVVIMSFFLGESIQRLAWVALAMALLGVALTVPDFTTAGAGDPIGVGFAFANAAIAALYYLSSKRILSGVQDVFRASAYMMTGTLLVMLALVVVRGIQFPPNLQVLLSMMAIGAFCTVMPIFATNQGIQKIGASQASLISTAEPVMSMVVAMILLGEIILPIQWAGAALIISSVILLQVRPRKKAKVTVATETETVL